MLTIKHKLIKKRILIPAEVINNFSKYNSNIIEQKSKKYFTEALLVTNKPNNDLIIWLNWHIQIIKFNHIVLIDNTNDGSIFNIANQFSSSIVEYHHIPGQINQSELYNEYVNNSKSLWVLPIDDDEYLYISDKYENNINNVLHSYKGYFKYSFSWIIFLSKTFLDSTTESYINTFNYYYNNCNGCHDILTLNKTICNTSVKHYYFSETIYKSLIHLSTLNLDDSFKETNRLTVMGDFHNPLTIVQNKAVFSKNLTNGLDVIGSDTESSISEPTDIFIAHYRYKTLQDWKLKIKTRFLNTTNYYNNTYNIENVTKLYKNYSNFFKQSNILINLYYKYF